MKSTGFVISFLFLFSLFQAGLEVAESTAKNVSNPLIYTRLRFARNFLQIYRRYQKHFNSDEKSVTIELAPPYEKESVESSGFRTSGDAAGKSTNPSSWETQKFTYYENDEVESTNLTLDDLIFEALDRAYLTRLMPTYIYNYDQKEDRAKASDPKLVSKPKCRRDLNYMIEKLSSWQKFKRTANGVINAKTHSPELMAMFDSFASEENGLLFGNYHWIGQWVQCNGRQIFDLDRQNPANSISFSGRYCTASLRSKRWSEEISKRTKELSGQNYFKYPEQPFDYARFFRIQVGICLPESCDSQSLEEHRDAIHKLTTFKLSEPVRSYDLVDLYCLPDETSELRQIEWSGQLFIYVAIIWCYSVFLATLVDFYTVDKPRVTVKDKLVSSLSLIQNFRRFAETDSLRTRYYSDSTIEQINSSNKPTTAAGQPLATSESTGQKQGTTKQSTVGKMKLPTERDKLDANDLLFLNAIKVLALPVIMSGHTGMLVKHLDRFVLHYDGLHSNLVFHFYASTVAVVDWFFVISGFLMAYLLFVTNKVAKNSIAEWVYSMFHRYWRLAPLYLILFWFNKSVFMYTSFGPNWDYGTSNMTLRSICRRESWIYPLTLTPNLHPLHEECILPAWYIGNDMQFYMITPFLLVLLHKSPLLGWLVGLGGVGASVALRFQRYMTDPKVQPLELMRPRFDLYMRNNWDMHPTYLYPQYRLSAYLIGILAGHYTFMVLSGQWSSLMYYNPEFAGQKNGSSKGSRGSSAATATDPKDSNRRAFFSSVFRLLVFLLGVLLLGVMSFATAVISDLFPVELEKQVSYYAAATYAGVNTTIGTGMALLLTTLMMGQFKWLRSFLSHPRWTVLSRINYIAFLIQVELIYWLVQSSGRTIEMNHLDVIKLFCCLCVFTYLSSFVLTILLEYPLVQLERQFVGNPLASWNSKRSTSSNTKNRQQRQGEHANESAQLCNPKH